jgi:histidyl-tRNA synthetase
MASIKPSTPKGTRDFSPTEMVRRNFIFDTIKGVFRKYGYQQIETPAMENSSTLMGKYGEEGDKLIFKILDSGDFLEKSPSLKKYEQELQEIITEIVEQRRLNNKAISEISEEDIILFKSMLDESLLSLNKAEQKILIIVDQYFNSKKVATEISEKALRYDLTVPFARYVVMHQNEITFPFKRFQVQPVWRADRPQRGRYREFYQAY